MLGAKLKGNKLHLDGVCTRVMWCYLESRALDNSFKVHFQLHSPSKVHPWLQPQILVTKLRNLPWNVFLQHNLCFTRKCWIYEALGKFLKTFSVAHLQIHSLKISRFAAQIKTTRLGGEKWISLLHDFLLQFRSIKSGRSLGTKECLK